MSYKKHSQKDSQKRLTKKILKKRLKNKIIQKKKKVLKKKQSYIVTHWHASLNERERILVTSMI